MFWTDSRVAGIDEVTEPSELMHLKPKGGGGTNMEAAFPVVAEEFGYDPEITCVVLTDGYTGFSSPPQDIKNVIWVITTDDIKAPYGKNIHLDLSHEF